MTQEEYAVALDTYIREQMATVPPGRKSLKFWTEFNKNMKENFDAQLAANGIVVQG